MGLAAVVFRRRKGGFAPGMTLRCSIVSFFDLGAFRLAFVRVSCYCVTKATIGRAVMRILGIDPGLRNLGWGVIDADGSRLSHVANGILHSQGADLPRRLLSLYEQLTDILHLHAPDTAAVEHTFVNKDGAGTLKLGQARAIALLVPAQFGIPVGEYAPNAVKKTVVGVGHAQKGQVDHMVRMQLPGVAIAGADAADALAVAICHAYQGAASTRLEQAVRRASA
jgi:crossover junction endodeoxyribonuclease RuvC